MTDADEFKASVRIPATVAWQLAPLLATDAERWPLCFLHVEPCNDGVVVMASNGFAMAAIRCEGRASTAASIRLPPQVIEACAPAKGPPVWDQGWRNEPPLPGWVKPQWLYADHVCCFVMPEDQQYGVLANAIIPPSNAFDMSRDYKMDRFQWPGWRGALKVERGPSSNTLFDGRLLGLFTRIGRYLRLQPGATPLGPWLIHFYDGPKRLDAIGSIMPCAGFANSEGTELLKDAGPADAVPLWAQGHYLHETVGSA